MSDVSVRNNQAASRYEAVLDGEVVGFATYVADDDAVVIMHTESSKEGLGVGSALARGALDDLRARGRSVVPQCPFIARYIARHKEYADLVAR